MLTILDPGHFHAALIQKEMYPQVPPRVSVYAPLSSELLDYLHRTDASRYQSLTKRLKLRK